MCIFPYAHTDRTSWKKTDNSISMVPKTNTYWYQQQFRQQKLETLKQRCKIIRILHVSNSKHQGQVRCSLTATSESSISLQHLLCRPEENESGLPTTGQQVTYLYSTAVVQNLAAQIHKTSTIPDATLCVKSRIYVLCNIQSRREMNITSFLCISLILLSVRNARPTFRCN